MKKIHTFVVLAYKESEYLEECIKSVLNQKYKSDVIIATSTPNKFIEKLSQKYSLDVIVNVGEKGIGNDFDFAIKCGKTPLVTIAHQDDIYDYDYSYNVVENYKNHKDAIILFTDYYEIKDEVNDYNNRNLKIKRILLRSLLNKKNSNKLRKKRSVLKFGNAISCPAVTFNTSKIEFPVFASNFKCNVDWNAWEKLSKLNGKFIFINECLMGHRIHEDSTTTEIIHENVRTKEDLIMFKRFWPTPIAKLLNKFYVKSEKNNNIKKKHK